MSSMRATTATNGQMMRMRRHWEGLVGAVTKVALGLKWAIEPRRDAFRPRRPGSPLGKANAAPVTKTTRQEGRHAISVGSRHRPASGTEWPMRAKSAFAG